MKKFLAFSLLTLPLASCGQNMAQPVDTQPVTTAPDVPVTAASIAEQWLLADVPAERLNQIRRDLQEASVELNQQSSLSKQDIQTVQAENDVLIESLNLALGSPKLDKTDLGAQATREQMINATRHISLNSMGNFYAHQNGKAYAPPLTYDDNGCSTPLNITPVGDRVFLAACDQHDFGWRNGAKFRELHNGSFKGAVDGVFLSNMKELCRQNWGSSGANYNACSAEATAFYSGVKIVLPCSKWLNSDKVCWPYAFDDRQYF